MTIMQANDDNPLCGRRRKVSQSAVLYPPLDDENATGLMSEQLKDNFRRLAGKHGRDDEMEQLAVKTAVLVHEEVKRMKSSIAELERLLESPAAETVVENNIARVPPSVVIVRRDSGQEGELGTSRDSDENELALVPASTPTSGEEEGE